MKSKQFSRQLLNRILLLMLIGTAASLTPLLSGCGGSSPTVLLSTARIYVLQTGGKNIFGIEFPGAITVFEKSWGGTVLTQVGQTTQTPLGEQTDLIFDEPSESINLPSTNPGVMGVTQRQVAQYKWINNQLTQVGLVDLDQGRPTQCIESVNRNLIVGCSDATIGGTADTLFSVPIPSIAPISGMPLQNPNAALYTASAAVGNKLFVGNCSGTVGIYDVSFSGALTPIGAIQVGQPVTELVADPAGQYLYVATSGSFGGNGMVQVFPVAGGSATAALTMAGVNSPSLAIAYVGNPFKLCLYVGDLNIGEIQAYEVSVNGTLSAIGNPYWTGANPITMSVVQGTYLVMGTDTFDLLMNSIVTAGTNQGEIDQNVQPTHVNIGRKITKIITVLSPASSN